MLSLLGEGTLFSSSLKKFRSRAIRLIVAMSRGKVDVFVKIVVLSSLIIWITFSSVNFPKFSPTNLFKIRDADFIIKTYSPEDIYDVMMNSRIFFHETTRRKALNERQSCAVESAAMHNPEKPVQLFMLHTEEFDYSSPWLGVLSEYPNIEIIFIKEGDYFINTPLEEWFGKGEWRTSPYSYIHLSDYMRMLSGYKAGGLYLDLDIITFKSYDFEVMGDFFVLQERRPLSIISNAVFHLNKSHRFLKEIITLLANNYDPYSWARHGSFLISKMLHHSCNFSRLKYPVINTCSDISLLPTDAFYALEPPQFGLMYERASNYSTSLFRNSYGVHEWNSKSRHEYIDLRSDQLYSHLAKAHCPLTARVLTGCLLLSS